MEERGAWDQKILPPLRFVSCNTHTQFWYSTFILPLPRRYGWHVGQPFMTSPPRFQRDCPTGAWCVYGFQPTHPPPIDFTSQPLKYLVPVHSPIVGKEVKVRYISSGKKPMMCLWHMGPMSLHTHTIPRLDRSGS